MRSRGMIPWRRRAPAYPVGERRTDDMTHEFEEFLERLFQGSASLPARLFNTQDAEFGSVDVSEKNGAYHVCIDLPGVEEKDIDLEVSDQRVTVRATRERSAEEESDGYHHIERAFGSFARSIELPDEVAPNTASASFEKGVLRVRLEKSPDARERTRKIPIGGRPGG